MFCCLQAALSRGGVGCSQVEWEQTSCQKKSHLPDSGHVNAPTYLSITAPEPTASVWGPPGPHHRLTENLVEMKAVVFMLHKRGVYLGIIQPAYAQVQDVCLQMYIQNKQSRYLDSSFIPCWKYYNDQCHWLVSVTLVIGQQLGLQLKVPSVRYILTCKKKALQHL